MNKKIRANIKMLIVPISAIVILTIISFVFAGVILGKINAINSDLESASKTKNILETKISSLTQISDESLTNITETVNLALPEKNSALMSVSQLKSMAAEGSLILENVKVGSEIKDTGGVSHVDLAFDVEGPTQGVISYLKQISSIAPINNLSKFKLSSNESSVRASVTTLSYWASLPKTIPSVESPFEPFTADEQKLIDQITGLRKPLFLKLNPGGDSGRVDPFSL